MRHAIRPATKEQIKENQNIGRDSLEEVVPDRGRGNGAVRCGRYRVRAVAVSIQAVHIFVPYSAGGGVDILARTLGDVVSRQWGQSVVVENRPGAGGVVASQALVASAPDGYTLMVVASGHATNPFLYPKIPYDTFKDFTPISLLASSPNILLVRADSPFKTLGDVIALARAKPGSLSFGHAGNGTSTHLAGELLKRPRPDRYQCDFLQRRRAGGQRSPGRANSNVVQQRAGIGGTAGGRHAARSPSPPRRGRRFCPMCPAWPRPCPAMTPKCGGVCSDPPACPRSGRETLA
jgi:hypothetical protein